MTKKEDQYDNAAAKPIFKRSTPVEVTLPLHLPAVRHITSHPLFERPLTNIEGRIVKIDTTQLPTIKEVEAMLSQAIENRQGEGDKKEEKKRNEGKKK